MTTQEQDADRVKVGVSSAPAPARGSRWLSNWLTTREAAEELGLSPSRIRQFYLEGRLPAVKRGRDLLFRVRDLERLRKRRNGRPSGDAWHGRPASARKPRVAA